MAVALFDDIIGQERAIEMMVLKRWCSLGYLPARLDQADRISQLLLQEVCSVPRAAAASVRVVI